ncbi:MAG: DUF882 domain-containing protein [Beijerinckiaceae bacterium]|nr:DUF882 domain-containing protein [Beijerinckiaceae bacterium]
MSARLLLVAVLCLSAPAGGEESPLRDPPTFLQPAETLPTPPQAPADIGSNGAAGEEGVEAERPAQEDAAAPTAKATRPLARVPMPPTKPPYLVNSAPPPAAAEGEAEGQEEGSDTQAQASAPNAPAVPAPSQPSSLFASLPQPGGASQSVATPAAPLVSAPQQQLPLPPSMRDAQPPEAESDGEEESTLPGGFEKQVDTVELACIKPEVMEIVKRAGQFFRAVPIVTSGFRARGRRGSLHRRCMAVDFVVPGVSTQTLASYLRSQPDSGGVGTYCNTRSVHIDIGEKRNWGYCGFHRTYFSLR